MEAGRLGSGASRKVNVGSQRGHILYGSIRDIHDAELWWALEEWLEDNAGRPDKVWKQVLVDGEFAAYEYLWEARRVAKKQGIAKRLKDPKPKAKKAAGFILPTARNTPEQSPWQYAYHVCGERKIGKTRLAAAGCEEFVIQFDKPNIGYEIRETMVECWSDYRLQRVGFIQILKELERVADSGDKFPYERIVVDGVSELYLMCQQWACKQHGVDHPSESEGFGTTWTLLRESFLDAVNRLIRLQKTANCGLFFISHTEWRERPISGGGSSLRLESDLPNRCEKIINGKVDAWFVYDYDDMDRVLTVLGSESIGAGHRIDGHFVTPDGKRVREIYMGNDDTDAEFGLAQFLAAFRNEQTYRSIREWRAANAPKPAKKKGKKKGARKKKKN